mgnify:CR=1 FL=1
MIAPEEQIKIDIAPEKAKNKAIYILEGLYEKGKTEDLIKDILGGLRSACTYIGAAKIKDFGKKTTFIIYGFVLFSQFRRTESADTRRL